MSNPLDEALPYEKWAINALVAVFLLVFLGVGLDWASVDNPVSDALNQYFLDPIRGESTGDSGYNSCLLYTSPSPRDKRQSRMPSSA